MGWTCVLSPHVSSELQRGDVVGLIGSWSAKELLRASNSRMGIVRAHCQVVVCRDLNVERVKSRATTSHRGIELRINEPRFGGSKRCWLEKAGSQGCRAIWWKGSGGSNGSFEARVLEWCQSSARKALVMQFCNSTSKDMGS